MARPAAIESHTASELPAPRFATAWASLVYFVATMSLAYPALGGAFLGAPRSDQFIAGYAFREFAAAALKAGEGFPQWNPYLFGGMPYIAAMHGDIFYPTFLLRMVLPTDVAMTWGFIIHLFLAGLFTFCFLRAYGIGFHGSLVGGLAYMMSGPIAAYASPGHDGKLFVSTLFPLALWMIVRGVRDNRPWSWGVLAITIGLAVLSPHPQLLQYLLLASGAFALWLVLKRDASGQRMPAKLALARLGRALGAVVVGFAMGAVQYASVLNYVEWSPRAGGAGWEHAVSFSMPIEELVNTVVPEFSGILDNYWGRNGLHFHSEYVGVVVLLLAGAGMFSAARRGFRWFWIGTLIVSTLWTLGGFTPFYTVVYYLIPGTKYFRAPSTMMYVAMFSVAVLAALGTERVISSAQKITKRLLVGWPVAIVVIGFLMATGLATTLARDIGAQMARQPQYSRFQPEQIIAVKVQQAEANQAAAMGGALRSILFALAASGLLWGMSRGRVPRRAGAWALTGLIGADLWSIERHYWNFSEPARVVFAADPAIEHIKRDTVPGRVLTWDPIDARVPRDPAFTDQLMSHRIRLVEGYHGNELGRYQILVGQEVGPGGAILSPQFWRHENVRYLYTTVPDTLMPQVASQLQLTEPVTKVVGPVKNARGSTVYLYQLPGSNPAAWVASVIVKGNDEQALSTVLHPAFDQTRAAIVDTGASFQTAEVTTPPAPSGVQATVTKFEPGEIDIRLDKPAVAGMGLVVSENFYPGWQASVNGQGAPTARANYNLIGVALPAGAQEIQLRFTDPAYGMGKTITLVALLVAIGAIVGGVILERRHPAMAT